jgi:DNA-binding NarL/FixJ family response regulator
MGAVRAVIIAALDRATREALRAALQAAGYSLESAGIESSAIDSPMALQQFLAARPLGTRAEALLIATVIADVGMFAPMALANGLPLLVWPVRPVAATARVAGRAVRAASRRLSAREREVLALVASGVSNKGIARALHVSPNTVKYHFAALFAKLGVTTRAEAVAAAARTGELSL